MTINTQVIGEIWSLNKTTPTMIDPTAPIPVQIGYEMLSGKCLIAKAKNPKLKTMPTTVLIENTKLVNPLLNFMVVDQHTSNNPAIIKYIQVIVIIPPKNKKLKQALL